MAYSEDYLLEQEVVKDLQKSFYVHTRMKTIDQELLNSLAKVLEYYMMPEDFKEWAEQNEQWIDYHDYVQQYRLFPNS